MNPNNDSLIMPGGALKACGLEIKNGKQYGKVQGYGIIFGDANQTDLAGDWFTKNTYLGPQVGSKEWLIECLMHHTLPIKGFETKYDHRFTPWKAALDDYGLAVETFLDMADDYERAVYRATMAGKMGLSSGAVGHTVRRAGDTFAKIADCGEITVWVPGEISFTPGPCEPRTIGHLQVVKALPIKSLVETYDGAFDVPQEVADEFQRLYDALEYQNQARIDAQLHANGVEARAALQRRLISLQIEVMQLHDLAC